MPERTTGTPTTAPVGGVAAPADRYVVFNHLIESHKSIFCLLDEQGKLVQWNKAVEIFAAVAPEALASRPFTELFPEADRPRIAAGIESTMHEGATSFDVTPERGIRHTLYHLSMLRFELAKRPYLVVMGMDFTECMHTETALEDATALSANLIETANALIIGLDIEGRITTFNPAAERATGYGRAEMAGRSWFEVLAPRDRYPKVSEEFTRLLSGGPPTNFRGPIVTRSGEERQIVWQTSQVTQQGRIVGTLSFGIDVSDQLHAEGEARSCQIFIDMAEHSPIATVLLDENMRGTYANPKFVELFGYTMEELQAGEDGWGRIFPDPAYRETVRNEWLARVEASRAGKIDCPLEISIRNKKGERRIVDARVARVGTRTLLCLLDLTARWQADVALKNSEKKYRELVENLHEGIWVVDENTRISFVNPVLAQMLGYEVDEMLHQSPLAFVDEALAGSVMRRLEQRRKGAKEHHEIELRRKDGTAIWAAIAGAPIFDDAGHYTGTLAAVVDISERKRAEDALKHEKAFSDAIIGAAPGAFYVIDQQANYVRWNSVVNELTGLSDEQLRTTSTLSAIHEEDRSLAAAKMLFAFATGFSQAKLRVPTRDRGVRNFLFSSRRFVVNGAVEVPYLAGIAVDITEREQAEEALRKEKAFSDVLIESVPGAFYAMDEEGNYYRWNSYLNRLTGLSDEALRHTPTLLTIHKDDRPLAAATMAEAFAKGYAQVELRVLSRDRGTRIFFMTARRFKVADSTYLVGVGIDTTERRALEEELERAAHTDALTGIPNRGHFLTMAEHEFTRTRRYGHPLSLWMLDVDHFKAVNDTHGHHVGDLVLQKLIQTARQTLRDVDILGRVGGEEFAVLLPETDVDQATFIAERLRQAVDAAGVPLENGPAVRCTVSIGVAAVTGGDKGIAGLLERADRALYEAKHTGRDKVCVAES